MSRNITSISIYANNHRVKLTPDSEGKFLIPNDRNSSSYKPLIKVTAAELINHPKIKYMDPVLTLDDGTKLRVFQGGDPSGVLTQPISLVEKHDKRNKKKIPVISKKSKSFATLDLPIGHSYVDNSDFDYPWDDQSLYDDSD
jgi:hypothetical protein